MASSEAPSMSPVSKSNASRSEKPDKDIDEEPRLIKTFPYPVVKGVPTYDTDYQNYGQEQMTMDGIAKIEEDTARRELETIQRAQTADPEMTRRSRKKARQPISIPDMQSQTSSRVQTASPASNGFRLRRKKASDGTIIERPPLSRSTSVGNLEGIAFVGPNFSPGNPMRLANYKRGKRLSMCWDNVSCFGSDSWTTCNAEYGSVKKFGGKAEKRWGVMSFENSRFLPHHPHWKDRPYKPGQFIKCPKSTYSDLGSYYVNGFNLPPEYQWTLTRSRRVHRDHGNILQ